MSVTFDHIVVLASDLDASLRHYSALLPVLGFKKTRDHVWVGEAGFGLDLQAATHEGAYQRYGPGVNHFSVAVESEPELIALAEALRGVGMTVPDIQEFGEARSLFLPDPDGLRLEIAFDPG